ncbi:hypothetical protein J6G99_07110 [bacterium]|nr:hypothetical protein [bacterium]
MKINNINTPSIKFNGSMGTLSNALYTLSNNDMLNASFVDIFAMDTPRTIVETKNRGKQAGIEMGFREYTGTFIAEFSAAVFAIIASKFISKIIAPEIKVNSGSWITNNGLNVFSDIYKKSDKTPKGYIEKVLNSMSGLVGAKTKNFADIDSEKTKPIIKNLTKLITDKTYDKKTREYILEDVKNRIIDLLGADNSITIKSEKNKLTSNLTHSLRDIIDSGKNIFFTESKLESEEILSKLKLMNKLRIGIAIPLSMGLAITNQYINRYLTKKRTGIDNFVGENNYENNVASKNEKKNEKGLWLKKIISAGIFILMLAKVMGVKKPTDLIKKLEFDGPATSGDAIKTIYGTLILGRIFASKDSTELRETNVRDYLGFLNWLVLGGFVAKGVGQILDPKQKKLFNISKQGKGIKHWLQNVSLKSQKEIIAQGGNVKSNLRKLNIAQMSGIAYSSIMLGVLLPKLNIWMTRNKFDKKQYNQNYEKQNNVVFKSNYISMDEFTKRKTENFNKFATNK